MQDKLQTYTDMQHIIIHMYIQIYVLREMERWGLSINAGEIVYVG